MAQNLAFLNYKSLLFVVVKVISILLTQIHFQSIVSGENFIGLRRG